MKITFVSNYINHHQIPFSNEMYKVLRDDYCFIQTEPMEEERVKMGWAVDTNAIPYLKLYEEQKACCDTLLLESDIVIFGGTEREEIIQPRLRTDKITIRNSERLYREGQWKAISPRGLRKKWLDHTRYRRKNVYLLCCGAYVASDFNIVRAYPGKKLKWGYFPEEKKYSLDKLPNAEASNHLNLLWAGRFLKLKHPEYAIMAAEHLKKKGHLFTLQMIGDGAEREHMEELIREKNLQREVKLLGFQKPEKVREYMEKSHIFMFTSNQLEGWGAVLNEAMNSGCAVVTNRAIGAVPYLVKQGENGFIYSNGKIEEFLLLVEELAKTPELRKTIGENAYKTINQVWNAKSGARRLLDFSRNLLEGKEIWPAEGPCSKAD